MKNIGETIKHLCVTDLTNNKLMFYTTCKKSGQILAEPIMKFFLLNYYKIILLI